MLFLLQGFWRQRARSPAGEVKRGAVHTLWLDPPGGTRNLKRGEMRKDGKEQRRELRARVSQRLRIRIPDSDHPAEICPAHDVSRSGLYFVTTSTHYLADMKVCVIRNFDPDDLSLPKMPSD